MTGSADLYGDSDTAPKRQPRVCPECGSDRWFAREFERLRDQRDRAEKRAEKLARENGLLIAQLKWAKEDRDDLVSSLQRKIAKQARVIVKFEKRLKGQQPWRDHGHDTAPAAEYDAARPT